MHQNKSNAISTILILCSKKGNSECGHITHNFCHNGLQSPFKGCNYAAMDYVIDLFADILNSCSRNIGTNL
jgi:hypothetical protein